MKKQLIGTTALVSAGLIAGTAANNEAQSAEPLALTIGGYLQVSLEYRDEDDSSIAGGPSEPGANLQDFGVYEDGEIQFNATTTLDNGIGVRARIEYEAFNQAGGGNSLATADERYIDFSGVFGIIRIGSDDDAAYSMQYQAPVGAYQIGVNTTTFAVPATGGNAITSYPTTYISNSGDSEKVIWFSPRLAGFQLGLSYAPDDSVNDQSAETGGAPGIPKLDNEPGAQEDTFSIGLNFVETFGDIDVAVAGGYNTSELEAQTAGGGADDKEQWSGGLNVGFAGFTVGGSIRFTNSGANNADGTFWDAGITYATGPLTVGFTWLSAEVEDVGGSDELDSFNVSGTYNLGPGVDVWGGVKYYDYQDGASNNADENEGVIIAIGSSVSF